MCLVAQIDGKVAKKCPVSIEIIKTKSQISKMTTPKAEKERVAVT
jgi:hypothetical protein